MLLTRPGGPLCAALGSALLAILLARPAGADMELVSPEGTPVLGAESAEGDGFDPIFDDASQFPDEFQAADPWEGTNRVFFAFNQKLDAVFWRPITSGYRFVVPEAGRRGIYRAFLNLNSPSIFVNDLLQLRFRNAGETLGRFVLNTTLGMGGLFDAGIEAGWKRHEADFGQTLALVGVGSGPYLVLPVFGPNTVRDGLGDVVDYMFQPLTYFLGPSQQLFLGGTEGLATRDHHARQLDALESSSVDFYAALRSAYFQNREAEIWGAPAPVSSSPGL
jgi:phospholipid-binding lipoprotein MlaA